ncbi:MAG: hypothetical protein UT19_C0003G0070 [Candidatus Woesebacteria bacterium GW2011_GWB1_39_10b]|uniref:Methyltransferase type 11 domain-containing protein n=1 Tax=Candidatus Woesebacteria bacterium GW2011_GWB1_39_10b TaxID=1618573 RepID=A0A0G0M1R1_9BACT|nr:MAG: hypothetical protein US72_C0005G0068 [Microgenomates group bacterium GW2011_GWC1_38_12]KKQ94265.1 MAG: hypothetical protein UT19_C0003G0070 [Candidatus Woesebacteria bacterium GW2011_GWB1_39_10b]
MPAAYDTYDYPSYWEGREYEHCAEILAIKSFLKKIPKIDSILEIGTGYGRLTPSYIYRGKRVILSDPSGKLLKIARSSFKGKKVKFIHSCLENLPTKLKSKSIDLAILVRVLHHIENPDEAFSVIKKLIKKNGYFIVEFANKRHLKAIISEFFHGNFTFWLDIFPKDVSGKKAKKSNIPFKNYHPDTIREMLEKFGFTILEERSVSNVRSPFLKKYLSKETLLFLEKYLQRLLAKISLGPSIFILAKKQ